MITKPNVRFHDGQILSEEPLNKAMEAVDATVEAANEAKEKSEAAIAAAGNAEGAAEDARTYFETLQNVISNLPSSGVDQAMVVDNRARIQVLEGKLSPNQDIPFGVDGYIDENGVFKAGTTAWSCTERTAVLKGQSYELHVKGSSGAMSLVCFYDAYGEVKSYTVATSDGYVDINGTITDDGIRYMRACTKHDNTLSQAKFTISGTAFDGVRAEVAAVNDKVAGIEADLAAQMVNVDFSESGYINEQGKIVDSRFWKNSGYVSTYEGVPYEISVSGQQGVIYIAFYDKNKNLIAGSAKVAENDAVAEKGYAPSGAFYMAVADKEDLVTPSFKIGKQHALIENIGSSANASYKYGSKLSKPYAFAGKHMISFGDSITAGVSSGATAADLTDKSYIKIMANKLGVNFAFTRNGAYEDNLAYGGTGFVYDPKEPNATYKKTITRMILDCQKDADVIYIAGGINDWQMNVPVGTLGDTSLTTVYGALHQICEHLKTRYPNAIVIFGIPIGYSNNKSGLLYNLDDYRNAIFETALLYDYDVVDASKLAFPNIEEGLKNPTIKNALMADGIHPTELGHKYMGEQIASMLL